MSHLLYQISLYLAFLPVIIGFFLFKYLNKSLKWYLLGMLVGLICGIISAKLGEQRINNHLMIYVNACSNIIIRTFFFYSYFNSKKHRQSLVVFLIAFLSGVCVDIFIQGIYMNQYLFMIIDVWATYFFLIALNQILKDENIESLRNYPMFWVTVGTLIFAVFDFFLAVSNGWLYAVNRVFFFMLWDYITPIFMFIRIIFVSIGYWKTKYHAENLASS